MSGYDSPEKALEYVKDEFNYWSGKLTDSSLQLCYALIGANWVVFQSVSGIQNSGWGLCSLALVIFTLGLNVILSWIASENIRGRYEYAESDPVRWEQDFQKASGKRTAWPFTSFGESLGKTMRFVKFVLPVLSGIFLIIGALLK